MNWSNGRLSLNALHHPVAVGPHLPLVVEVQAVRVGVAGHVEPVAGHLLAEARRREVAIDHLLVGVRRRVGEERIDLRRASAAAR